MAFHHDIFGVNNTITGEHEVHEYEYTHAECIENGWMDANGVWLRAEVVGPVVPRATGDDGWEVLGVFPDPLFGARRY